MSTAIKNRHKKSAQISLLIPPELRPLLAQAAALHNIPLSCFIYQQGYEAALQVVEKQDLKISRPY